MFTQFKKLGLVSVMAVSAMIGASAATIVVDGITYTTKGNEATVGKPSTAYSGDIVIPATVTDNGTTYTVTGVAATAFKANANVTSITFAEDISFASLPRGCFQDMKKLTTLVLPKSVKKLTQETFKGDSVLQEIVIPGDLPALKASDFQGCVALKKITFAAGAEPIQVDANIWGATKPNELALEELVINRVLTSTAVGSADLPWVGKTSIVKVTYDDAITSIPSYYFQNCSNLSEINIPAACTEIGAQALLNTGISAIEIPAGVTSIATSAFAGCKNLTKVELKGDVTSIGDLAFHNSPVSDINWPASLTSIGIQAFWGSDLTGDLVLPAAIKKIGKEAFADNAKLTSVALPANVQSIGEAAFRGDNALAAFSLDASNESFKIDPQGALISFDGTKLLAYPAAATSAIYTANIVEEVAPYAFNGAAALREVVLPACRVYGDHAFDGSGLGGITMAQGSQIGRYVLANCKNLKWAEVTLTEIPFGICAGCSSLENYKNHGRITIVRQEAFKGCTSLKELNLKDICVIIEADAFADVDGLNLTVGTNNPPALAEGVFTASSKVSATVPAACVAAYKAAPQWKDIEIKGDENLAVGGLDLGMPAGLYYAGEDGNLHCRYSNTTEEDVYEVNAPHTFQLQQFKNRIYGASAGTKFTYSGTAGTEGDGKLFYISQVDNYLFQATVLDNAGNNAYLDPFALYVDGDYIFVSDRNVALRKVPADAIALPQDYPSFMELNWMNAYQTDYVYGGIKAGFSITQDDGEALYWLGLKYNNPGILRFKEKHIGSSASSVGPETGYPYIFKGVAPIFTTFYLDVPNGHMYIYIETEGGAAAKEGALKAGVYRFNIADIEANPNPAMLKDLNPVLIDGSPVKYEGAGTNEHVGIQQFTADAKGEYLYWCYRAPTASDVELAGDAAKGRYEWAEAYDENNPLHKSGIKRIKLGEAQPEVEMMIPGVQGYGLTVVNYEGSQRPETGIDVIAVSEKEAAGEIVVAEGAYMVTEDAIVNVYDAKGAVVASAKVAANAYQSLNVKGINMIEAIFADGAKKVAKVIVK